MIDIDESSCKSITDKKIKEILSNENFVTRYLVSTIYGTNWCNLRFSKSKFILHRLKAEKNLGEILYFFIERKKLQAKQDPSDKLKKKQSKRKLKNEQSLLPLFLIELKRAKRNGEPLPTLEEFVERQKNSNI